MTCTISLTQGKVTLVDDADYEWLNQWRWFYKESRGLGYAVRTDNRARKTVRMHRVITQAPDGFDVDHRDGNTLNNQRSNLRVCEHQNNTRNQAKKRHGSSQYKGVHWCKRDKAWIARVAVNGKRVSLGYFKDEHAAPHAYDTGARLHYGEFARVNFTERCGACGWALMQGGMPS